MTTSTPFRPKYDVVIVGARCAGAATAMLLARHGLRVLAVERSRYGSDSLSTHALMRSGVLQLARWGVLGDVEAAGTPAVERTAFHYGTDTIDLPIQPRDGVRALYAPRRTVLDKVLVDGARDAGAEVVHGFKMTRLMRTGYDRVCGVVVKGPDGITYSIGADLVVGADGVRSSVAKMVEAEIYHSGRHATGNVYAYWDDLEIDRYNWYFRPGVSAGAIPTNDGQTCVFVSVPEHRFRSELRSDVASGYHQTLMECAPELAAVLSSRKPVGKIKAFAGINGFFRRSWGPGWALVGDAGYFKDPLTAHGISDAFRDAELLTRAVLQGNQSALIDYQTGRDYLSLCLFEITDRIASFQWSVDEIKQLHRTLSKEMNREVDAILRIDSRSSALARSA